MPNIPQKIIPHLWFDDRAEEAASFYTSLFDPSRVGATTRYGREGFEIHGQPEGKVMTVEFDLEGYRFIGLNGGPHFSFTPAISFFVAAETEAEIHRLWEAFSDGGSALMELGAYDWSEKYGWVQDRFGLSWQLALGAGEEMGPKITPSLLFVGDQHGRAEEALNFYTSVFPDSEVVGILRYEEGEGEQEGSVKHARFTLDGEPFIAMDSGHTHAFSFNEAVSFLVACRSQEEVDYYWGKLTPGGDPDAQQCGWLKDRFGVSWQVSPVELHQMMQDPDAEKVARVTRAFLQMKKFDVEALRQAYDGR